jgi:hypothetical protein
MMALKNEIRRAMDTPTNLTLRRFIFNQKGTHIPGMIPHRGCNKINKIME